MHTNPSLPQLAPRFVRRAVCALFVAAFASLLPAQTAGTGSISGRVLNEATSQYLNNARVTVKGTDITTFTDSTGSFRISGVPTGTV
ncbi:MAG TPA: carboxypeptidase regulatory-like domain-containing protein, partial [Opitutaceae bacterium]|nr:carboxypeptidase regulatory-like domain-containing protein [Opitutaceae bacterium]